MSLEDCMDLGCDVALTSLDLISANTIADLSLGLLKIVRNVFQSICPNSISLILECPSWKWDFFNVSWYLNTTIVGAIFFARKDDEDAIIFAQKERN